MMKPTLEELSETLELNKADGKHDRAVYGEVKQINSDQTYQVSLNGSDTTVKCARLSGAKVGDTVMVELLANGYAVVTGTVGGDTDASDAQASANAAVSAAGQAQSAASAASTAAATAVTKADQASAAASAASSAAATADSKAEQAASAAATADSKADAASSAASRAESSASAASAAASRAEGKADAASASADAAQASASNASEYAARALGNLASVESVAETLSWITAHGTMALTQDQQLDPTHVYFVQDNNGDYNVGGTRYSIVTEPDADDLSTYYELSINQSLNNYVATHLAVDGEGLWLLPDAGGNTVLIATGAGSRYTTAGTYIIGKVNNNETVFAKFASDGATIGKTSEKNIVVNSDGILGRDGSELVTQLDFTGRGDYYSRTSLTNRLDYLQVGSTQEISLMEDANPGDPYTRIINLICRRSDAFSDSVGIQIRCNDDELGAADDGISFFVGNSSVELTALAKKSEIPSKTSDLANDSGFITNTGLFKVVTVSKTISSLAAHSNNNIGTLTVPSASRPSGMTLVGVVGYNSTNYRVSEYKAQKNGGHSIEAGVTNTTAAAISSSFTCTWYLLYIKGTSA